MSKHSTFESRSVQPARSLPRPPARAALLLALLLPSAAAHAWQTQFDTVPTTLASSHTTLQTITLPDSRVLPYGVMGPSSGAPVLFIPGTPSGAYGASFIEGHLSSIPQEGLRLIVPERPGYGTMPVNYSATIASQVDDWIYLMDQLGYSQFKVFAASGGGPFADNLLTRYPSKVTVAVIGAGIHAGASSATLSQSQWSGGCQASAPQDLLGAFLPTFQLLQAYPQYYFPPGRMTDIIQSIPGLPDLAVVQHDAYTVLTQNSDAGMALEIYRFCNENPSTYNFAAATMPVYIYSAANDANVLQADSDWRESVYPNATHRKYDNDTHIAWLRHFGQVLLDLKGQGDKVLLCVNGQAAVEVPATAAALIQNQGATLDICSWVGTAGL